MRMKTYSSWFRKFWNWLVRQIPSCRSCYGAGVKYEKLDKSERETYGNDIEDIEDAIPVSYFHVYRYATAWDIFLMFFGTVCTLVKAILMPLFMVLYAELTTLFIDRSVEHGNSTKTILLSMFGGGKILTNATWEENSKEIVNDGIAYGSMFSIFMLIDLIAGTFAIDCFNWAALRQITKIRIKYFESLMRQEVGWYDVFGNDNNFAVRNTEDIEKIREGISEKVHFFLNELMVFVASLVISFYYGWKLSLVVISYMPIAYVVNSVIEKAQMSLSMKEENAHSAAANITEEVLSGIRTVFAFGGEKVEIERYNQHLLNAKKSVQTKVLLLGIREGILRFLFFATSALSYWYGVKLVLDDRHKEIKEYTPTVMMITYFGLANGLDNLLGMTPFLTAFAGARASATEIFKVIDRPSKIDSMPTDEMTGSDVEIKGNISFKNVYFNYPSRPDVQVLQGLNLEIEAGQSIAIVGHSGNGKSTCLQLLQRFYDPDKGQILMDGIDTRKINVNALRSAMATVGQEPILFSTTIGDNIRYGKPDASNKEVIEAARNSGAHDFIVRLPQSYNTLVGEKGSQLSGGQKQRIAIARALIQNPKILLLDEATSALDYQSEKFVQETLDRASVGRTTITVSHRLSAIRSANRIVFVEKGIIVEDGTHSELMALKGRYYEVITAGNLSGNGDGLADSADATEIERPKIVQKRVSKDSFSADEDHMKKLLIDDAESKDSESGEPIQYGKILARILKLARPEWCTLSIGSVAAFLLGISSPIFTILFAEVMGAMANDDDAVVYADAVHLSKSYIIAGIFVLIPAIVQMYYFSMAGFNLALRIRLKAFTSMMKQECGWFDEEDHSSSALSTRLSADASDLQESLGFPILALLSTIPEVIFSTALSMAYSIKLTVMCVVALPVSIFFVMMESRHVSKMAITEKETLEVGIKIASEAITNIRTVASLRQEKYMIERFTNEMMRVERIIREKTTWRGLVYTAAETVPFFSFAFSMFYGAHLIAAKEIHFKNVLKSTEVMLMSVMSISSIVTFAPQLTAAIVGAHRLFQIIDRRSTMKSPNKKTRKNRDVAQNHDIEYKKINFHYPTRPDVQVLKNLDLKIHEGQTIALVGSSGSGKSTCVQLLQRFYDPSDGHIFVGFDEISADISLKDLRSKLSIVSQEPVLFDKTIAENIAYGDTSREVPMDEIINAAKMANIHDFIVQLPLGYETNVGNKTAQLSGGQKQRVAIARSLVRNPKILLLDEATSSLDLQSEQVVQQALDSARCGRTCLIIAHRLSTVQNADVIYVLKDGNIVEHGTHIDLLAKGGIYAHLYYSQMTSH